MYFQIILNGAAYAGHVQMLPVRLERSKPTKEQTQLLEAGQAQNPAKLTAGTGCRYNPM